MDRSTVVITGSGNISALGYGEKAHRSALLEGCQKAALLTEVKGIDMPCTLGFEVTLPLKEHLDNKTIRFQDRPTHFGILAAKECLESARMSDPESVGLIVGSNLGGIRSGGKLNGQIFEHGPRFVTPLNFQNSLINSPTYQVGIRNRFQNLYSCISTGACSGLDAIGFGFHYLESHPDEVLFCGSMEDINQYVYIDYLSKNALSESDHSTDMRPFDLSSKGTLLGEGACLLSMESVSSAEKRGVSPLATVSGYGTWYEKAKEPHMLREGMKKSMEMALKSAALSPEKIDGVIASANGEEVTDRMEALAIQELFVKNLNSLWVTAPKSHYGECVSFSGALGVLTGVLSLQNNEIYPTNNFTESPSGIDLDIVKQPREASALRIMVNSFSSSGRHSSMVLERIG